MDKEYELVFKINDNVRDAHCQKEEISRKLQSQWRIGSTHSLDAECNYVVNVKLPEGKSEADLLRLIHGDGDFITGQTECGTNQFGRPAIIVPVARSELR